jgi:hypothetical protein
MGSGFAYCGYWGAEYDGSEPDLIETNSIAINRRCPGN